MKKLLQYIQTNIKLTIIFTIVLALVLGSSFLAHRIDKAEMKSYEILTRMEKDYHFSLEFRTSTHNNNATALLTNAFLAIKPLSKTNLFFNDDTKGGIIVYDTIREAELEEIYLNNILKYLDTFITFEKYGQTLQSQFLNTYNYTVIRYQKAILVINNPNESNLTNINQQAFNRVVSGVHYSNKETMSKEVYDKKRQEMDVAAKKQAEILSTSIQENHITSINNRLTDAEKTLERFNMTRLQADINASNIPEFSEQYASWAPRLEALEVRLDEQNYLNAHRYKSGVYEVGKDIPAGEYILTGHGLISIKVGRLTYDKEILPSTYYDNCYIITIKEGDFVDFFSSDDNGYMYDIALNPEVDITKKGFFKVGLHIPAGEYKIVINYAMAEVSVYKDSNYKPTFITSYYSLGDKNIILKDGQYVKVEDGHLEKIE